MSEVLRDGASSQYGSDAIAGVINFEMKDASEGGQAMVQYGQFYEDENSLLAGANIGFALPNNGFINLTLEGFDNDALSRWASTPGRTGADRCGGAGGRGRMHHLGTRLWCNHGVVRRAAACGLS